MLFPGPIWGFFRVTCSSTFPSTVGVRTMRNGADLWIDMPSSFEGVVTMVACCILYFVCTSPTCNPCRGALWLVTCDDFEECSGWESVGRVDGTCLFFLFFLFPFVRSDQMSWPLVIR